MTLQDIRERFPNATTITKVCQCTYRIEYDYSPIATMVFAALCSNDRILEVQEVTQ